MTEDELFALYSLALDTRLLPEPHKPRFTELDHLFNAHNIPAIAGAQNIGIITGPWFDFLGGLEALWDTVTNVPRLVVEAAWGLWQTIWGGIGGGLRWVGDRVEDWARWMRDRIEFWARWVRARLEFWARWMRDRLEFWARWVFGGLADIVRNLSDGIFTWLTWLEGRVGDWAGWVGDRVGEWASWVRDRIEFWARWARDRIEEWARWVRERVEFWARWGWEQASGALSAVRDRVMDGITWLAGETTAIVEAGFDTLIGGLRSGFEWFANRFLGPVIETAQFKLNIPRKLWRGDYTSADDLMDDLLDPLPAILAGIGGALLIPLMIVMLVQALAAPLLQPLFEPATQRIAAGVGAGLPTVGDILEGWNRAAIDRGTARTWLRRQGLGDQPVDLYEELRQRLPGPNDLVRFAVREAFDPALAAELGYVTPLPPQFAEELQRQGFAQEWADRYWWAHWDLPSVNQGFDMFHRRVIDETQLRLLLRVLDLPPDWHQRFIDIAYRPFTRVDVRRMHLLGILDRAGVKDAYLDLGFAPDKADAMTEFTIRFNAPDDETELDRRRDLAAGQVRQAYRRHVITRDDALERLVELRYTEDDADFLLGLDDVTLALNAASDADIDVRELSSSVILRAYRERMWTREQALGELQVLGYMDSSAELLLALEDEKVEGELTELDVAAIREDLRARLIDIEQARVRLNGLDIEPRRRDLLLVRWTRENRLKTRPLTRGQIVNAWDADIFTEDEAMVELGAVGFSERNAGIILELSRPEPSADRARQLSAGAVAAAYRQGLFTPDEALDRLVTLGFGEPDASVILQLQDRELTAGSIERAYRKGVIARDDALSRIVALGFSEADAATRVGVVDADLAAGQEPRELAAAALLRAMREAVLTRAEAAGRIRALGFTAGDTEILIRTEEAKGTES